MKCDCLKYYRMKPFGVSSSLPSLSYVLSEHLNDAVRIIHMDCINNDIATVMTFLTSYVISQHMQQECSASYTDRKGGYNSGSDGSYFEEEVDTIMRK